MSRNENAWSKIVKELNSKGMTIATMESCTGGGIADKITNISGASAVLKESYVTYSNEAKIKQGVAREVIEKYTVYSPETAVEMAKAVKKNANSSFAIGVTGQLGRIDPNNPVDKLNYVWYAIVDETGNCLTVELQVIDDNRKEQKDFVIEHIAKTLLNLLF